MLLGAFATLAQDRVPFESNSPWETNVGIAVLNIATNSKLAWKLIEGIGLPPGAKPGKWSELERNAAGADMCREFTKRYPADFQVGQANKLRREYLMRTIELGNTNRIAEFEDLLPKKETELARMRAFRVFSSGPSAVRAEWEKNLRQLKPWIDGNIEYEFLLLAEQSAPETARRLAEELIKTSQSKAVRERATEVLKKYELLGQPVHLQATLVDGKPFDLEHWKGKVVLLHFWSPTRPRNSILDESATGIPAAKAAYAKFHEQGLEVLGINLARDPMIVQNLKAGGKIPWPHYWASTNLSPELRAVADMAPGQIGVGIPCFALLDKEGTLRDRAVPQEELFERIEKHLR